MGTAPHDRCADAGYGRFGAAWSPTGDAISFGTYDPADAERTARAQIATADGSELRLADAEPGTAYDIRASEWSNDGSRFVVNREFADGRPAQPVIVSTTVDDAPIILACGDAVPCAGFWVWSPDDSRLIGYVDGADGAVRRGRSGHGPGQLDRVDRHE